VLTELGAMDSHIGPAAFVADAITLPAGVLGKLPPLLRAQLVVQDEASQVVAHAVGAAPGCRCLDLCAAPGGKTLVLWTDMDHDGLLVAADRRPSRLRLLRARLNQTGVPAPIVQLDATRPLPFADTFDRVLLDAPCSGLGIVRRDPDVKWSRTPEDLARFSAAQAAMIDQAALAVRPGGRLIYATCSSEPEENEGVVDAFLERAPTFRRVAPMFGRTLRDPSAVIDTAGDVRTLPFRHRLDAFFASVLARSGA
jgi:16S rRNA (cytosine967-C5)-methyltransferase